MTATQTFLVTLLAFSGAVTAVRIIWAKAVRPVVHAIYLIETHVPTLVAIAAEFQPNHGTSLRDQIDMVNMRLGNLEQFHVVDLETH